MATTRQKLVYELYEELRKHYVPGSLPQHLQHQYFISRVLQRYLHVPPDQRESAFKEAFDLVYQEESEEIQTGKEPAVA